MLSLDKGTPIAKIIKSREFKPIDGKSKYLGLISPDDMDDNTRSGYRLDPYQMVSENEMEEELNTKSTKKVRKSIRERAKSKRSDLNGKLFILNDGLLSPVPDTSKERDVLYVSGPSGSGKSTFLANYLDNYMEIYPKAHVFMFSAVGDDPAFYDLEDAGNLTRIVLDNEYLEDLQEGEGFIVDDFYDSAVIFDDVDVITNKTIRDHVLQLRSECLEIGRHYNITTCCTTHQLMNYKSTKILLQEATKVVVFPRSGSTYHITRFLKEYCGFNKEQIKRFYTLKSRWVMVSKTYPQYILAETEAYLL